MKYVYFVRHGETEGNLGGFFQNADTPLSEAGHIGAKAVAERCTQIGAEVLLASPFFRTQQTAQYIRAQTGLEIETFDCFHECLQPLVIRGQKHDSEESLVHLKDYKENFFNDAWRPEGAENFSDVLARIQEAVSLLEARPEDVIVVVSHGAFLQSLSAYLLLNKSEDRESNAAVSFSLMRMSNVGITQFTCNDGNWKLFTWNDHAHFAE